MDQGNMMGDEVRFVRSGLPFVDSKTNVTSV